MTAQAAATAVGAQMLSSSDAWKDALRHYVINLDRSHDRWDRIDREAKELALDLHRVPAVDGMAVPRETWQDVDHRGFLLAHGRRILPGEYGCYRSHLAALDAVIAANVPAALICEDDIVLDPRALQRVAGVLAERPDLDMLKLTNHRVKGFVRHGGRDGTEFGRCIHGPQGSAACYAVTRAGAQRLRTELAIMRLPYDVAFERGWAMGASIYTLRSAGVLFRKGDLPSTIADGTNGSYAASKAALPIRLPTALFRAADYARRAGYALR